MACLEGVLVGAVILHPFMIFLIERPLIHGQRVVGRALIDGQMFGVTSGFLNGLHAARTGTDDGNTFANHVNAFLRPSLEQIS